MSPPLTPDAQLLFLQGKVARLRTEHEDLASRERVMRASRYTASADVLKDRMGRVFAELKEASVELTECMRKAGR